MSSSEIVVQDACDFNGGKLSIERMDTGHLRTTRFGISPMDVIRVTDGNRRSIVDLFLKILPEFSQKCGIPADEVVLVSFYDATHSEHVLYLQSRHPVAETPRNPGARVRIVCLDDPALDPIDI